MNGIGGLDNNQRHLSIRPQHILTINTGIEAFSSGRAAPEQLFSGSATISTFQNLKKWDCLYNVLVFKSI